jgi:Protein of unknown function (DUF4242)
MQVFSRFLGVPTRPTIGPTRQFRGCWPPGRFGDEAIVPTFLVERYVPHAGSAQLAGIVGAAQAAQAAAGWAEASPGGIRYLAVTLVPGDELCYCLFEAPSIEAVRRAHELAQISCERIVEAFHVAAKPPGNGGSSP